jgi:hypothetical protein
MNLKIEKDIFEKEIRRVLSEVEEAKQFFLATLSPAKVSKSS